MEKIRILKIASILLLSHLLIAGGAFYAGLQYDFSFQLAKRSDSIDYQQVSDFDELKPDVDCNSIARNNGNN
jgi:hypothetical protein